MSPETKRYWLYALRLEKGKYYIGITSLKDPNSRIKQHVNGFGGAKWTHRYKPIASAEKPISLGNVTKAAAEILEHQRTMQYMKKYGYNNVRGADLRYDGEYAKVFSWYIPKWRFIVVLELFVVLVCLLGMFLALLYRS